MRYLIFILLLLISAPNCVYSAYFAKVTRDNINIRADSTVMSQSLGVLNINEEITVIKESYDWCKIKLPARFSGFIAKEFVTLIDKHTGEINAQELNIRSEGSAQAIIIGKIKRNQTIDIIDQNENWIQINAYPYCYGWVHKDFLKKINDLPDEIVSVGQSPIKIKKRLSWNQPTVLKTGLLIPFYRDGCPANYVLIDKKKKDFILIYHRETKKFANKKVKLYGINNKLNGYEYIIARKLIFQK